VLELRQELQARSLSPKGLKSQLIARLTKTLRVEQENEEETKRCDEVKCCQLAYHHLFPCKLHVLQPVPQST